MAKPKKIYDDPKKQKRHEAALARRRQKHAQATGMRRAIEAAQSVSEGEVDFDELIRVEKERMGIFESQQSQAASKSPKTVATARENLTKAFDLMGGVPALVAWGRGNPTEFYRMWARLIPRETVEASVSLPLEDLLSKLQGRQGQTVAEAALGVGLEILEESRAKVSTEELYTPRPDEIN